MPRLGRQLMAALVKAEQIPANTLGAAVKELEMAAVRILQTIQKSQA
jgi:hypothetical protein